MQSVVIVDAARTPIGRFLGEFRDLSARDLGIACVSGLLDRVRCSPDDIELVVMGCGRQAGGGPNVARQILCGSGIPDPSVAYTVNMACGSGLLAMIEVARSIQLGEVSVAVAGGVESMTRLPYFLEGYRLGYSQEDAQVVDGMYRDGFLCPMSQQLMGETAETLASRYEITREEQDQFALSSQAKAGAAIDGRRFDSEIIPVQTPGGSTVAADGHPRPETTLEKMAKLQPVFRSDGSVTAGNSSGITDGAAAMLLTTASEAKRRGWPILATLGHHAAAGVAPEVMGLGPVPAIRKLLQASGGNLDDFDLIEVNEAFAAQVIACDRELSLPADRLNPNGGAIALGHPIGATGARIVVTLLHELARREGKLGLASLCISGGLGLAATFRR